MIEKIEKTEEQKTNEAKAAALFNLIRALVDSQAAGISIYSDGDMLQNAMGQLRALGWSVTMVRKEEK